MGVQGEGPKASFSLGSAHGCVGAHASALKAGLSSTYLAA
jgi:hypothetical protein